MKRAYSVDNVLRAKFNTLALDGVWKAAIGEPELTGTWIIYGGVKNGKTSFAMMLSKYLTKFSTVLYNSVEEGFSLSIQSALRRTKMVEAGNKFLLLNQETVDEIIERLNRKNSPNIIVVDSVQFWELTFRDYKRLKAAFPGKLFVYISHSAGISGQPEGRVAVRIWRDASVAFRIEGFKAFPVGRYGGGEAVVISEERARKYWGE